MQKLIPLASLLCIAAQSLAQQVVVPPVFATAEAGTTGNLWRAGTNRYQSAYDSSLFTSAGLDSPVYLHTLEFRLAGGLLGSPTTYPSVQIYLDYCVPDHAALNAAFASNRTRALPRTPEYSGPIDLLAAGGGTPNDWVITVPLDIPFLYNPELGRDLLVEIVILGAPSPLVGNTSSSTFNVTTDKARATRSVGSTTATTGTLTAFAPVIRFGYNHAQASARHVAYGTGCYQTEQSFYEVFPGSANDLSGTTLTATKNPRGGYDVSAAPTTVFDAPTSTGLALGDDEVSLPITLPFTFDYAGGSTNTISVDSNGRIFLNGTTTSAVTATGPGLLSTPVHVICPSWQDLEPDGTTNVANVFAHQNAAGNEFYVTWSGVECFGANDPSTFQVVFIDDGVNDRFQLRYQTLFNNSTSNTGVSLTGFSLGGTALDPGASNLSAGGISTSADSRSLSLSASPRPVLGTTSTYTLTNIRANAGVSAIYVSFFGSSPTPLSSYGLFHAGGCFVHLHMPTAVELGELLIGSPTCTQIQSWPNDINFLGAQLNFQGFALAPLENGDGVITSNAIRSTLGLF